MSTTPEPVSPEKRPTTPPTTFVELERMGPNAYGMVAVISQRVRNRMVTFAIFREFDRDGNTDRTSFVPADHAEAYLEFAHIVVERVRQIEKSLGPRE